MLEKLVSVDQAGPFLCAVILFKMVIDKLGNVATLIKVAERFIDFEITKFD